MIILGSVLTITLSGILLGTRFAFAITGLLVVTVSVITYMQTEGILMLNDLWKYEAISVQDVIEMGIIFFFMCSLSWLSNRETEQSLARARSSEMALVAERNLLEIKVEERTRELKDLQMEQVSQLSHLAELGKISSGIFHDLMNPLNSIVAGIDTLNHKGDSLPEITSLVHKTVTASRRMGDYLTIIRKQIKPTHEIISFSPEKEIRDALDMLGYKARIAQVICSSTGNSKNLIGNPLLFHQIALNLISNAIDAYKELPDHDARNVFISYETTEQNFVLHVQDHGCGIAPEYTEKIFEPFFTTKDSHGVGIGLSHTKKIIEQDFKGTISFTSDPKTGTCFSVIIPLTS